MLQIASFLRQHRQPHPAGPRSAAAPPPDPASFRPQLPALQIEFPTDAEFSTTAWAGDLVYTGRRTAVR
jgi:hypothetical protein